MNANNATKIQDSYKDYEELLLRRDQLTKEAGSILTAYTKDHQLLPQKTEPRIVR